MTTSTRSQAIDAVLADAVTADSVPNVVAVAADCDGVIYEGAFGPRTPGDEGTVDAHTPLRIMSMTKPVITVAALHLAEQRKLDIDAPVEEYCPEFAAICLLERIDDGRPVLRAPSRKVTVKQLITHTSGLGYWFWNADVLAWEKAVGAPKPMTGLRAVLDAPLVAERTSAPPILRRRVASRSARGTKGDTASCSIRPTSQVGAEREVADGWACSTPTSGSTRPPGWRAPSTPRRSRSCFPRPRSWPGTSRPRSTRR